MTSVAIQNATPPLVKGARATQSTIFLKILMALSGIVFILFVLAHMYGNLKAFSGHDAYNEYAEHLRTLGTPMLPRSGFLWIMRAVLIVALVVHVYAAATLWRRAKRALPSLTKRPRPVSRRGSSRRVTDCPTMRAEGRSFSLLMTGPWLPWRALRPSAGCGWPPAGPR